MVTRNILFQLILVLRVFLHLLPINAYLCNDENSLLCEITIVPGNRIVPIEYWIVKRDTVICKECDIGDLNDTSLVFGDNVTTVDLSDSKIHNISHPNHQSIIGSYINFLYLRNNEIRKLNTAKQFQEVPRLITLDLSFNRINEIDGGAFKKMFQLEILLLSFNQLVHLNDKTFLHLRKLHTLRLNDNFIKTIPFNLFVNNWWLSELTLFHNNITLLPESVHFQLSSIKALDLSLLNYQVTLNDAQQVKESNCYIGGKIGNIGFSEEQLLNLSCSYQYTQDIPPVDLVGTIKYLNLRNNAINALPKARIFSDAPDLHTIDLAHNKIAQIHPEAFHGLGQLETLLLAFNNIVRLEVGTFSELKKLTVLQLHYNEISELEWNILQSDQNILSLSLNNNNIERVIDVAMDRIPKLKFLDMSKNAVLSDVSISVNSKNIKINKAQLTQMKIGEQVHALDASDNQLVVIDISSGIDLAYLNLSANRLQEINFYNLSNFIEINLSRNNLSQIRFGKQPHLELLDLSDNRIHTFTLGKASKLVYLNLSRNYFNGLHQLVHDEFRNLHTLDVSHNPIKRFQFNTFANKDNLKVLKLRDTQLYTIDGSLFRHLINLEVLDLSFNSISTLNMYQMFNTMNVVDFYIDGNVLTELDELNVVKRFPKLDSIGISQNAWSCQYLRALIAALQADCVTVLPPARWAKGSSVNGIACHL